MVRARIHHETAVGRSALAGKGYSAKHREGHLVGDAQSPLLPIPAVWTEAPRCQQRFSTGQAQRQRSENSWECQADTRKRTRPCSHLCATSGFPTSSGDRSLVCVCVCVFASMRARARGRGHVSARTRPHDCHTRAFDTHHRPRLLESWPLAQSRSSDRLSRAERAHAPSAA